MEALHALIQQIRIANGQSALEAIHPDMRWREDLGFDSFALAELAVYTERDFGVDAFADGVPATVGNLAERIRQLQQQ
ncbi:MAG: acyl carrier protein [Opitutales bacterium]|nr:acyl carrier protein [Opitutales bacterium]